MPRYFLVAGVDFGTSFSKVVLREQNTRQAVAVQFPQHLDGLLPSLVGIDDEDRLLSPAALDRQPVVPYLKMLAADVASGKSLNDSRIRLPASVWTVRGGTPDLDFIRDLLAFYFAHMMAAVEEFIWRRSPWMDFDFGQNNTQDHLVFQLAVPTGLLVDTGQAEKLFRQSLIVAHELRREADPLLAQRVLYREWSQKVRGVLSRPSENLERRFQWQCLIYPEVAAAVQTIFRSPNARDGLYITMDVGAGTVDINAFRRNTGQHLHAHGTAGGVRRLDYYASDVKPLGIQNLSDPHHAVEPQHEDDLMAELRQAVWVLYHRAKNDHQRNQGVVPGHRTWDRATLLIFGGGSGDWRYRDAFARALWEAGIHQPQIHNLPAVQGFPLPPGTDFGRFAVAYGMSFFKPNLDQVKLPNELKRFDELYPPDDDELPREYGFNWED
ncbi:MAG: hypothetical protein HYY24_29895 [Verrucomicrobia bacterium]|nr:hypothetical protein [Verrucomicrobiota bacterium]